jgi:hypothetical protein
MSTESVPVAESPPVQSTGLRIWPVVRFLALLIAGQQTLRLISELTPVTLPNAK